MADTTGDPVIVLFARTDINWLAMTEENYLRQHEHQRAAWHLGSDLLARMFARI